MTRYVVIGAGALGGLLAAELHASGREVVLIARGEHGRLIGERGLRVARPQGVDVVRLPVAAGPHEVDLRTSDVLVLAVKTQDVEDVLQTWSWRPVAGGGAAADLPVITLQNGLATEDAVLRRFAHVYAGTAWISASHLTAGEVVSPGWPAVGILWLGRHHGGDDHQLDQIAADLRASRFTTTVVPDIARWKAHKLRHNVTNGLDLFGGDADQQAAVGRALMAEVDAVYAAAGIDPVDPVAELDELPDTRVGTVPGHEQHQRSTWQSFARGAGSEIDYLNGEIVLLGRRLGVPTPVNATVQRLLGLRATLVPSSPAATAPLDLTPVLDAAAAVVA